MEMALKNVTHHYQDGLGEKITPLKNINFTIKNGERIVIYGPSGSGKSTLLFILGCLLKPSEGDILFAGQSLLQYGEKQLAEFRNQKIGFVFQLCYLLPTLTVEENIVLPLWIREKSGKSNKKNTKKVKDLLEQLDLEERAEFLPYQLSGGQRRRVALARAMINEPDIILADEPTAELDEERRMFVGKWLMEETPKDKIVVVASHDPALASYAGKVYDLKKGLLQERIINKKGMCI